MPAGRLRRRLVFQSRAQVDDGMGNVEGDFGDQFSRWAEVKPSLGIETVNAARLQGQQPVDITVRQDNQTRTIASDWRAVDETSGTVYAVTSPAIDLQQDGAYLTVKAVSGVAA